MESFISRLKRKKTTTLEKLIEIEESLKKIEDYRKSTEQKQKRTVANILIYGAALYVLACVVVFVWYLPESWLVRLGLLIPFIMVPFIIYGMKKCISGYFNSKMIKANKEYEELQQKKKDVIDNIMETETFNKAKEILSKYAPEKLGRREVSPTAVPQSKAVLTPFVARSAVQEMSCVRNEKITAPAPPERSTNSMLLANQHTRSIPKPMFSRDLGFTDKLIEYIVGDGPSYRFALICKHCNGHNGMALQEEFPYLAYNCCYCLKFNPARSQRPLSLPLADSNCPQLALPGISEISCDEEESQENTSNLSQTCSFSFMATEKNELLEDESKGDESHLERGGGDNKDLGTPIQSAYDKSADAPSVINKAEASVESQEQEVTEENTADVVDENVDRSSN